MKINPSDQPNESPDLRIYFERTGGFMGRSVTSLVDTSALPEQEAQSLKTLIAEAGFFELPPVLKSPAKGADQFQYKLVVEGGNRQHIVETTDMAAPESLRPLLNELTILARTYPIRPENNSTLGLTSDNDLTSAGQQ